VKCHLLAGGSKEKEEQVKAVDCDSAYDLR